MKNFKRIVSLFLLIPVILIIILYAWANDSIGKQDTFLKRHIGVHLSQDFKDDIKLLFFKKKSQDLINYNYQVVELKKSYLNRLARLNKFQMSQTKDSEITLGPHTFSYKRYSNKLLVGNGPRSYMQVNQNELFLITGSAQLFFTHIPSIKRSSSLKFTKIKTNLVDIIGKERIQEYPSIVKHMIIDQNKMYVSFIKKEKASCHFNSIYVGKINFDEIKFESFFEMKECQTAGYLSQSGGIISKFKNDHLLYTIGDYRAVGEKKSSLPQSIESLRGKIIEINKKTKNFKILSLGHRNPQGLYFDKKNDIIISSEHGPKGGCEINLNFLSDNKIKNFGWPISSYGEHYNSTLIVNENAKKDSPLIKSHSKKGFVEPILYFNPSIAPSQLVKIDYLTKNTKKNEFLMGSMGKENDYGKRSLHYFSFDENYNLEEHSYFKINERVRDITTSIKFNKIFVFLESSGSILIIEK